MFVRLSAIGVAAMWIAGLAVVFREDGGLDRLGRWWMTWGLGAFWWPGFLVVCIGVAGWVRRRFPLVDEWKPRAIDRDRINRVAWVLAIAFFALGTIWRRAASSRVRSAIAPRAASSRSS